MSRDGGLGALSFTVPFCAHFPQGQISKKGLSIQGWQRVHNARVSDGGCFTDGENRNTPTAGYYEIYPTQLPDPKFDFPLEHPSDGMSMEIISKFMGRRTAYKVQFVAPALVRYYFPNCAAPVPLLDSPSYAELPLMFSLSLRIFSKLPPPLGCLGQ